MRDNFFESLEIILIKFIKVTDFLCTNKCQNDENIDRNLIFLSRMLELEIKSLFRYSNET